MKMKTVRRHRDSGSMGIELAIVAPAVLAFVALGIAFGRVGYAHMGLDQAVQDSARIASSAPSAALAKSRATEAIKSTATNMGCTRIDVSVNTSAFSNRPGTPGKMTVTAKCRVDLKTIALPGAPGTITLTSTAASVVDTYGDRS